MQLARFLNKTIKKGGFILTDADSKDYIIGKPDNKISTSDYVLNDFNEDEKEHLETITNNIINSISILIDKKLDLFSSTVNNN